MKPISEYLDDVPTLHTWDGGKTWNMGGFNKATLSRLYRFLTENLPARPTMLETGAGNSTICMLYANPACLCSIAPDTALFERIRRHCSALELPNDTWMPYIEKSQWVLPRIAAENKHPSLDFAFIDGDHGWPTVFIDFYYCNYMLKTGGYLLIDDIDLHTIGQLVRLLRRQSGFEIALELSRKTLIFKRTTDSRELPINAAVVPNNREPSA